MIKLILATNNPDKIREIRDIFKGLPFTLTALSSRPKQPELRETGATFKANAIAKAATAARFYNLPAVADDSGLEVDALDGAPGVYSARFAGPEADAGANNRLLLAKLAAVPAKRRTARFRTTAAYVEPRTDTVITAEGVLEGVIIKEPRGRGGFGYDPLFVPRGSDLTLAQMSAAAKNRLSHRGQAFRRLKSILARRSADATAPNI